MLILNRTVFRLLLRPLLFRLPPERAHKLTEVLLKRAFLWRYIFSGYEIFDNRLAVEMGGLHLSNPVGLAAGYDKDCKFLPSMLHLGFGYVVGGTVTERPRPGNPKPRVLRYSDSRSLVNALGFPSMGLEEAARNLARYAIRKKPIVVSIAGLTAEEFLHCHRRLEPLADAIELNISSPNTAGVRVFQDPEPFKELIRRLNDQRHKPLFVKLPPYFDEAERERVLKLVTLCLTEGVNGVTATNSKPVQDARLKVGAGGLSGHLIFEDMLRIVSDIKAEAGKRLTINACGGISSGQDAWQALQAGATTVQLLTSLIYEGPTIARDINKGLIDFLHKENIPSLSPSH
ncbi:MAG: quinone-dependent dihydroorotate dehydrogenase [Chloroflexi bacterium]|nr:quinone-dependent dihydroorotate dehydrogenase [Chloroflexota bacterium]